MTSQNIDKRDALQRATKRAFRAARRTGKPIGWAAARLAGQRWCVKMWPDFYDGDEA